jgi:hypothetical protein
MTESPAEDIGPVDLIVEEIRSLHKGRGIQAADLAQRLGPHLRELVGGDPATLRQSLIVQLNNCAALLAADMRLAVTASLALSGKSRGMPTLRDRVQWLSDQIGKDSRTGTRRVEAAERLLAEQVVNELRRRRGQPPAAPSGWYLAEFRALLRLDTPAPESHEHRRVISTTADLREVTAWVNVPKDSEHGGPRLSAEMLYGGSLVRQEHPFGNRFQFVVQLPEPLQPWEEHEYGLISRVRAGEPMSSHYLMTPECQCDSIDLTVRFHPDHPPRWVRRVAGETIRTYEEPRPTGKLLTPNAAGEVRAQFSTPVITGAQSGSAA